MMVPPALDLAVRAIRRGGARLRVAVVSDLAVHGLAYLGALLLFRGRVRFGRLLFK